jgi:hypothetical protein
VGVVIVYRVQALGIGSRLNLTEQRQAMIVLPASLAPPVAQRYRFVVMLTFPLLGPRGGYSQQRADFRA